MYKFQDRKFAYIGKRSTIFKDTKNVIFLYNEGIILRLNWSFRMSDLFVRQKQK